MLSLRKIDPTWPPEDTALIGHLSLNLIAKNMEAFQKLHHQSNELGEAGGIIAVEEDDVGFDLDLIALQ